VKVAALELLEHALDPAKRLGQDRKQGAPFIGDTESTRQAFEERCAQPLLEYANLLADGGLRDIQFERSARKAQVPRRRFEGS
jgi:hypothetical protein